MKIFKKVVALLLVAVLAGAGYQWVAERADRQLIPGELIEVDGHQFHLLCEGVGEPLVLLENGLWGSYPDWMYVLDAVAEHTRVCVYDRLGLGWSSANDNPTRAADVAQRLNRLLGVAELDRPMILVGFSAGGLYVREYSQAYPEQVVGMVLLDSSHEQQAFRMPYIPSNLSPARFCAAIAWTGVVRLFDLLAPFVEPSFGPALNDEQMRIYNQTGFCKGLLQQSAGFEADLLANRTAKSLGPLPLTVIAAGKSIREQEPDSALPQEFLDAHERIWPQLQEELSTLSSQSTFLVAEESGHAIQLQQPVIVIDAIVEMVGRWRKGR